MSLPLFKLRFARRRPSDARFHPLRAEESDRHHNATELHKGQGFPKEDFRVSAPIIFIEIQALKAIMKNCGEHLVFCIPVAIE